ncbi:MAG: serine hydrolase domain-containing protein [Bacteroidia bacterium]|nr:serine hydrolase domain-containing protein [Bacteroidia bacterium]
MKNLALLFCVILSLNACNRQTGTTNEQQSLIIDQLAKERINTALQSMIADTMVVGVSALIFEKGEEVYFNAFGYADREAGVPMARNTIATIYSMTKPISGATLMTLYENGAFTLDEPLAKYAPEFADMQVVSRLDESGEMVLEPANRAITIADITRHTAGFSRRSDLGLDKISTEADLLNLENSLSDMATKLSEIPLGYHPGERWEYGISVDVQAYLTEKLSGKAFDEYMKEVVLDPLGMDETGYFVAEDKRDRVAAIYFKSDSGLSRIPDERVHTINYSDWSMKPGGWGLKASIDDYMKFAQMLLYEGRYNGDTILKAETVKRMATNHLPAVKDSSWLPSKGRVGFGIDFAVRTESPQSSEEMNGVPGEFFWDGAASTLFWVDPQNELTAVLFVQIMPFQGEVHKAFKNAVYGPYEP